MWTTPMESSAWTAIPTPRRVIAAAEAVGSQWLISGPSLGSRDSSRRAYTVTMPSKISTAAKPKLNATIKYRPNAAR